LSERNAAWRPGLNLSRRPFTNGRPVTRVALLLWLVGLLLLAANVASFWTYFAGTRELREELVQAREKAAAEQDHQAQLESELAGLGLGRQNEQVEFLNAKIAERTFSWSLLFDRLAQVLPRDVRIDRLDPGLDAKSFAQQRRGGGNRRDRQGGPGGSDQVELVIRGSARNGEALLQFVNNLFAHPAFGDPDFSRESKEEEEGVVRFDLRVKYLPKVPADAQMGVVPAPAKLEEAVEER
jgi:hypothetical protein